MIWLIDDKHEGERFVVRSAWAITAEDATRVVERKLGGTYVELATPLLVEHWWQVVPLFRPDPDDDEGYGCVPLLGLDVHDGRLPERNGTAGVCVEGTQVFLTHDDSCCVVGPFDDEGHMNYGLWCVNLEHPQGSSWAARRVASTKSPVYVFDAPCAAGSAKLMELALLMFNAEGGIVLHTHWRLRPTH